MYEYLSPINSHGTRHTTLTHTPKQHHNASTFNCTPLHIVKTVVNPSRLLNSVLYPLVDKPTILIEQKERSHCWVVETHYHNVRKSLVLLCLCIVYKLRVHGLHGDMEFTKLLGENLITLDTFLSFHLCSA